VILRLKVSTEVPLLPYKKAPKFCPSRCAGGGKKRGKKRRKKKEEKKNRRNSTFETLMGLPNMLVVLSLLAVTFAARSPLFFEPSSLRPVGKKVFAHYFTLFKLSIDNKDPASDYYQNGWINPLGENEKHAAYGGLIRDRPLQPNPHPRPEVDFQLADLEDEVRQAKEAGLDGFTLNILDVVNGTSHWPTILRLMEAAINVGDFHIVIMPDMTAGPKVLDAAQLAEMCVILGRYSSAFRLADNRLVVSPFAAEAKKDATYWPDFLSNMTMMGDPAVFFPCYVGGPPAANAAVEYGLSRWGNRYPAGNADGPNDPQRQAIAAYKASGRLWMQPVSVQDSRPRSSTYWEAGNLENFRKTWTIAIEGNADWVQIPTWNDFSEHACIVASEKHGFAFLDINQFYTDWFRTETMPTITQDALYLTHRAQFSNQVTAFPQTKFMSLSGTTPARDQIEVMAFFTAGATDVVITAGGVVSTFSNQDAGLQIFTVALQLGNITVTATRNGDMVALVKNQFEVLATPYVQDFQYLAVSSLRSFSDAGDTSSTTASCVLGPLADPPGTPCELSACCANVAGLRKLVRFIMSDDYDSFSCPSWLQNLVTVIKSVTHTVCMTRRGSSEVDVEFDETIADNVLQSARDGSLDLPRLISVVDPSTNEVITLSAGVSIAIIVGAIIGGLILIALLVILLIWCCKRKRNKLAKRSAYIPMTASPPSASSATTATSSTVSSGMHGVIVHDVVDVGEGILPLKKGDQVLVARENWYGDENEWMWVTHPLSSQKGYVPRDFCRLKE
jgi:hypothetical protein